MSFIFLVSTDDYSIDESFGLWMTVALNIFTVFCNLTLFLNETEPRPFLPKKKKSVIFLFFERKV